MKLHALLPPDSAPAVWEKELAAARTDGLEAAAAHPWSGGLGDNPIRELNAALERALAEQADLLIVGAHLEWVPGSLSALLQAASGDPMILALAPRHNGGGLSGLSRTGQAGGANNPAVLRERLAVHWPPVSYVPLPEAPVIYLKTLFLNDICLLDTRYACWRKALDDLVLRANRYGFLTALANHAYVWRQQPEDVPAVPADERRLAEKFPESIPAGSAYLASTRPLAEELCLALTDAEPLAVFDFSYFSPRHDGTTEAGVRILRAAGRVWQGWRLAVIAGTEVWSAYRLFEIPGLMRLEPGEPHVRAAVAIRIGQPFKSCELPHLFRCAPVVAVMMLDAIALDCQYLRYIDVNIPNLDWLWSFICREADLIFTQSQFTLERLRERFIFGPRCRTAVTRHSLDLAEYGGAASTAAKHILIMGNRFPHKFVTETAAFLAPRFSEKTFVAVGLEESTDPNVVPVISGAFDEEAFSRLYLEAECLVYPSTYEGFGFPLLHALARGKVVYARDSALNRELAARIPHSRNIRFFRTLMELALRLGTEDTAFLPDSSVEGEKAGWDRSAGEILHAVTETMARVEYRQVAERLRLVEAIFGH